MRIERPIPKLLVGSFVVAILAVVVAVIVTLSRPAPPPAPLPSPNGYDDLARAGALVADGVSDYPEMSRDELQSLVARNEEALRLAEVGLSRECRVPVDSFSATSFDMEYLAGIKRLAQAMAATGRLAELEDRPAEAAEAYVTVMRLGQASSRGGLLIHAMVGIAVEQIGAASLEKLMPSLGAKTCRETAAAIESSESGREPMEAVLAQERAWMRRAYGWRSVIWLFTNPTLKASEQSTAARMKALRGRVRQLLIELASRAYELDKGQRPKGVADLVPEYLKAVPPEPQ